MKTIEIPTLQNIVVQYEQATALSRLVAGLLDLFLVSLGWLALYMALLFTDVLNFLASVPVAIFSWMLLYLLYHVICDVWNIGQTPGKSVIGIQTVRLDGRPLRWSDAFLRALLLLVDGLFSFSFLGVLLIQTNPRSQRLGDMAAHTTVINTRSTRSVSLSSVLDICTADNHAVTYPQVCQLSESDMLLVRAVLLRWKQYPNPAHQQTALRLAERLAHLLKVSPPKSTDTYEFLETLLRDYIVLTR
ncbi:MAG: RDD family protein [Saprospiraceae bacterium]|nr:RDD family protein [Saprospiraceae bacterium]MDW8228755.1 RDD family protein [Saprospiraceae bacterium]